MLEIQDGAILLTRGDSAVLHVAITNGATGEDYEMQESDKLILTVRKQASKLSPVVLEKVLTGSGDFILAPRTRKSFLSALTNMTLNSESGQTYTR